MQAKKRDVRSRMVRDPIKTAEVLERVVGDDLHTMRVLSLANSTIGVLHAATLAVSAIGKAYAEAVGVLAWGCRRRAYKRQIVATACFCLPPLLMPC